MSAALEGIRVIEVAGYVTGPYAGMLLGDLGAEVIKIEEPGSGDPYRGWGSNFISLNRNKKSVALDLRSETGRESLLSLIGRADVLIENFRPGVADRLGFGYATLQVRNPRLVYCSITGFGPDGPYRDWPGYDTVGQAMSGLLGLLTDLDDPGAMGISLSDHLTGLFACYGILGALMARERTGEGQLVETSLLQASIAFNGENAARYFATGQVPSRASRSREAGIFVFTAGDGLPFVVHLSSPPKFWEGLLEATGRGDLAADARFGTREGRREHHDELVDTLATVFGTDSRAVWLERLRQQDVPCAPINRVDEVFEDPQVRHLGMRRTMGKAEVVGPGVTLQGTPVEYRLEPPTLGEHTDEVLR